MVDQIISGFSGKQIKTFQKEFIELARVEKELDRYYGTSHSDLDKYLPKFKKWIEMFNEKYGSIKIIIKEKLENLELKFMLKEESLQKLYENAITKISGIKSVGSKKFGAADAADTESFQAEIKNAKDTLFLTFLDPDIGQRAVLLSFDKTEKMVWLHYDIEHVSQSDSPDFKIACFYALSEVKGDKIDLLKEGQSFGFHDLFLEKEKAAFFHKTNPQFLE